MVSVNDDMRHEQNVRVCIGVQDRNNHIMHQPAIVAAKVEPLPYVAGGVVEEQPAHVHAHQWF